MLAQLTISNFAIVRELEIDFHSGMTAITGETGAGKSIAIDALGLCLGGKAEADMVRRGATRADLCARFALKRHVARRVLAELQAMGLAEHTPNVGASVKAFSPDLVRELYELRALLESSAAARMPLPLTEQDLAPLRALQREHDAAVARGDLRAAFWSNLRFHDRLFALCGNSALTEAITEYARRTHPIRSSAFAYPGYLERSRAQHHAMLDALQAGDRRELVRLCREHLRPSRDLYLRLKSTAPE